MTNQLEEKENNNKGTVYLIDGSGFIFRAFHALPQLRSPDGTPVGAVVGFFNMLLSFMEKLRKNHVHDHLGVVFDAGRQTFRQQIYKEYKAHRPEAPPELVPQFKLIREVCQVLAVPHMETDGFEADDIIASYAKACRQNGYRLVIVSSDKDLMQLVDETVTMFDHIKSKTIGIQEVMEKFGVPPSKVIDVQALMGDSSDNVPGVPGIGPKTAAELINQFETLENLLETVSKYPAAIKQAKRRETILQNKQQAIISKQLVTLHQDVPLPLAIEDLTPRAINQEECFNFIRKYNFKSIESRLKKVMDATASTGARANEGSPLTAPYAAISSAGGNLEKNTSASNQPSTYEMVTTEEALQNWCDLLKNAKVVSVDTETTSLDAQNAVLVGISLAVKDTAKEGEIKACYIPINHHPDAAVDSNGNKIQQLRLDKVRSCILPYFTADWLLKVGHNLKYDFTVLEKHHMPLKTITDTMLMSYCLDMGSNGHGMDELARKHLGQQTITFADVAGSGKGQVTFDKVPLDKATAYAAEDAEVTLKLYEMFKERLQEEHMLTLYETVERPLIPVIARMERNGIKVDKNVLKKLGEEFDEKMKSLEGEIYQAAGRTFNIGSPKQLGEVMFDDLSMQITPKNGAKLNGAKPAKPKKTKTGAYVTDASVLETLAAQGYNLPRLVLKWRGLAKLKSTYVDGLLACADPNTSRVHTSFSLATTVTGRLSSSDPNLQNIPIRTEDGRKIRQAFVPEDGMVLVSLDYSQIELRLLAHKAKVQPLIDAFKNNDDIHKATASHIFGVPQEDVTAEQRRQAKSINFGIIYGSSAFGLSEQLNISTLEASQIINAYFARYPGIQAYMENAKQQARDFGYVETVFKRRCHIPTINDKNFAIRGGAERQAINSPLQGSNADIIKKAMVAIDDMLEANRDKYQARMLLQVHDELLFEMPKAEVDALVPKLKQIMESAVQLEVPLIVEAGLGKNWDEAH